MFGVKGALNRSQIGEIIGQFITMMLFCGFVAAVIVHYQEWAWNVVDGFAKVAGDLGASKAKVEDPIFVGIQITKAIFCQTALNFDPQTAPKSDPLL